MYDSLSSDLAAGPAGEGPDPVWRQRMALGRGLEAAISALQRRLDVLRHYVDRGDGEYPLEAVEPQPPSYSPEEREEARRQMIEPFEEQMRRRRAQGQPMEEDDEADWPYMPPFEGVRSRRDHRFLNGR